MIRAFRAAAAAACAALSLVSGPASALDTGPIGLPVPHSVAAIETSDLGLNDETSAALSEAAGMLSDHMGAIVDVLLPPAPLALLVAQEIAEQTVDREQDCLANAVYFEARGEPLEGQLAVAEVVLNRAASGRYPATICAVVTQHAQFSFVRHGVIPAADRGSEAWRNAVAIARIAQARETRLLPENVLWYHADYVSPSWGRRLARNTKIGLHIFYS